MGINSERNNYEDRGKMKTKIPNKSVISCRANVPNEHKYSRRTHERRVFLSENK